MIKIPKYLEDEAKAFWQSHAKRLWDAGLLTEVDVEGFVLLCEIWGLLRRCRPEEDSKEAIRFVGLTKQFQTLGRQYGIFPKDRKQSKLETHKAEADDFGL